jgi:uncharacterized protein
LVARDQQGLDDVAAALTKEYGIQTRVIAIDLTAHGAAQEVYDKVTATGWAVDYLVNDAGFGNFGFFAETEWAKEDSMIALNIGTLTALCKLFIPSMVARKQGRVLNLASTAAFLPGPMMAVYYATKAYVLSFSQAINNELRGTGVTVTALCPGPTQTHFAAAASAQDSKLFKRKLPTPEDVARYGYAAMMSGKSVAIHGFSNKLLIFFTRFVPRDVLSTSMPRPSRPRSTNEQSGDVRSRATSFSTVSEEAAARSLRPIN